MAPHPPFPAARLWGYRSDAWRESACCGIPLHHATCHHPLPHSAEAAHLSQSSTHPGSLTCVGIGMTLGSHLSPLARSHIEQADVVFAAMSDGIVEQWIAGMNGDVRSLQPYYAQGKSRLTTYREMVAAMLDEVRAGKQVVGAFYGHPGVFVWPSHEAIAQARKEGYAARMEPGISAEDCLYADLGIDPGRRGCQHYEASQLLFYERRLDPSAYLVLWQVGVAGDASLQRHTTGAKYRQVLVDRLARDYPLDHEVILYRGATLPIEQPQVRRFPLRKLTAHDTTQEHTLFVPPARRLKPDRETRARLSVLDVLEKAGG
ncbi:MAG: hypothetical protein JSR34_03710 [Proteobacteria bacterium]|nr:hypothetical protein [Pseudomonadota bacterium]